MSLQILGMGAYHPEGRINNQFLEELGIGSSGQWIVEKIGIYERRTTLPLEYIKTTKNADPRAALEVMQITPMEMALRAANIALQRAGIQATQIGLIVSNTCTPFFMSPSSSQQLAEGLGIEIPAYDLFTACPAFALHLHHLNSFAEGALPEYVLCVSTAALTHKVNYNDRSDSAIWGDGAAAWVVSSSVPGKLCVKESLFSADPTRCHAVTVKSFGHFHQDGRAVRDFSVRHTVRMVRAFEERHNLNWQRDIFIGHQANATMLDQICNNREIPAEHHWHNVAMIGNQAGAGAPAVLAQHWDTIKPDQNILVAVVGAGLSWGSLLLYSN